MDRYETNKNRPLLVGLGGSAGAVDILNQFFETAPEDSGLAFGIVIHLPPDYESQLPKILANYTQMPVCKVEDGMSIEADHIYVIPRGESMCVDGERFVTAPFTNSDARHHPVDTFFKSMAESYAHDCAGIVLSGTGIDGTAGLQALKQSGALTLAQAPETAEYDNMPQNAILAGAVDETLTVEKLTSRVSEYRRLLDRLRDEGRKEESDATHASLSADSAIGHICNILQEQTGRDFSQYKRSTLMRRIGRRMLDLEMTRLEDYADFLEDHTEEGERLLGEILITVTAFFRDPKTFERLEETIDELVADAEDELRIWVSGCASGEEAYSIAMLVRERLDGANRDLDVHVFGTDIDEESLETARSGRYPEKSVSQLSDERRNRFFVREGEHLRINESIRQMCIFSMHDLTRDPPFSHIDLLTCRNTLIYMQPELQSKVLPVLHYALRPGGYLLLGPAETADGHDELFAKEDPAHHLYRAKETTRKFTPEFFIERKPLQRRSVAPDAALERHTMSNDELGTLFQRQLMHQFGPPAALVDDHGKVLYLSSRLGRYLELSGGPLSDDILDLARENVRVHLRSALQKARSEQESVTYSNLHVQVDGTTRQFDLLVTPLKASNLQRSLWMVVFREGERDIPEEDISDYVEELSQDEALLQLEAELQSSRKNHRETIVQLKRSNEELTSHTEELQSSNEELQTSQEELKSLNQELQRVNSELEQKVEELNQANTYMRNLLKSTQLPTIFLDCELRIRQFTPASAELFRMLESDVDRHLGDINLRLKEVELMSEIRDVLETHAPREVTVKRRDERGVEHVYLLRINPYRTLENTVDGVVLTFIDITERRDFEKASRHKDEFLAMLGHELRNPLAAIQSSVDVLKMYSDSDDQLQRVSGILCRQSQHMTELVDGLLDASRIKRGKLRLKREDVEINRFLREVTDSWAERVDRNGLRLETQTVNRPLWVHADRTRLTQILGNVLTNAIKFTSSPGTITVTAATDGESVAIEVTDTGVGLTSKELEHIFEPFQQSEQSLDRSEGGLGMGLPLARGLARLHHGQLVAESDGKDKGSTFRLSLPLTEPVNDHEQRASE